MQRNSKPMINNPTSEGGSFTKGHELLTIFNSECMLKQKKINICVS